MPRVNVNDLLVFQDAEDGDIFFYFVTSIDSRGFFACGTGTFRDDGHFTNARYTGMLESINSSKWRFSHYPAQK